MGSRSKVIVVDGLMYKVSCFFKRMPDRIKGELPDGCCQAVLLPVLFFLSINWSLELLYFEGVIHVAFKQPMK